MPQGPHVLVAVLVVTIVLALGLIFNRAKTPEHDLCRRAFAIPPEFSLSMRRDAKGTEVRAAARGAPATMLAIAAIVIAAALAVGWALRAQGGHPTAPELPAVGAALSRIVSIQLDGSGELVDVAAAASSACGRAPVDVAAAGRSGCAQRRSRAGRGRTIGRRPAARRRRSWSVPPAGAAAERALVELGRGVDQVATAAARRRRPEGGLTELTTSPTSIHRRRRPTERGVAPVIAASLHCVALRAIVSPALSIELGRRFGG